MKKQTDIFSQEIRDMIVETYRSGNFHFQVGLDMSVITPLIERVEDAHAMFASVPMLPQIAMAMEREVLVSSVFGTNTIEGGTMSETEISEIFRKDPQVEEITAEKERRVVNLKRAYEHVDRLTRNQDDVVVGHHGNAFLLSEELIIELHELVTGGLTHPSNIPGRYRNNTKQTKTVVGDPDHGGVYTPPKSLEDIRKLMKHYIQWINSEYMLEQHPLVRAPLAQYYFERIHPFYDGNGRLGRLIEALLLKCSGMALAHHGLARAYLEQVDEYFLVFNSSRKLEGKERKVANTPFVEFFLIRLREVFFSLHSRVNQLLGFILYEHYVSSCYRERKINERQFMIINNLLPRGKEHALRSVQSQAWYTGMYEKLTRKTRDRDLRKLVELGLVSIQDRELKLLVFSNQNP